MRVLVINDLSCIGKCSLSVAIPIISACGVTCDVLPTAILSTHTGGFEGYTFRDLTEDIPAILTHWRSLKVKFDYILSGYLGSVQQIEAVLQIKRDFLSPNGKFIVDPVMGDNGKLYAGFNDEFVNEMRKLCAEADYILPNLTEACLLANVPYPKDGICKNANLLVDYLRGITKSPVLTGVTDEKAISVYFIEKDVIERIELKNATGFFCGAGDVFASAFVGTLARGKSVKSAVSLAAEFTTAAVFRSAKEVEDKRYGLNFEAELYPFLKKLNG